MAMDIAAEFKTLSSKLNYMRMSLFKIVKVENFSGQVIFTFILESISTMFTFANRTMYCKLMTTLNFHIYF